MATPVPMSEQTLIVYCAMSSGVRQRRHDGDAADDGQPADADGQGRRGHRPEHEEQDDERQRQGHDLGAEQVVLERTIEVVHEGHAARCSRCSSRSE